jgi:hypothetical protein
MNKTLRDALLRPLMLVVLLGLLVVSLKVVSGWWKGELNLKDDGNWLWLALFPLLLVVWWKYFSVFGCKEAACLQPKDEER